MTTLASFSTRATARQAHLRILETTDLHAHAMAYDYFADRPSQTVGLSRVASLIKAAREEAANTLLFDNGDLLQGNPMGDYIAYERGVTDDAPHPMIAAMNTVGFDAATIGNHDFNYGVDYLRDCLSAASFDVVLANIATRQGPEPGADETLFKPYALLDREVIDGSGARHALRVGVIGLTPPQVMAWDRRHLEGRVTARDIIDTAEALVPRMRAEGAGLVVALSHSGIGSAERVPGSEHASVPLAAVPGIDVILTGHTHQLFPSRNFIGVPETDAARGLIHGKPAVMAGFWGSHLGVIDLLLERDGDSWSVADSHVETRPIARRNPDRSVTALVPDCAQVTSAVAQAHAETLDYIRRPIGHSDVTLQSYFALVSHDPSARVVSDAQRWYVERQLAGSDFAQLPLLSAAASFKAGGRGGPEYYTDVSAGSVALHHLADLYLYPNMLRAVKITGAELRGWLERSAGLFRQITPGEPDQALIDPEFPSYNFDAIDGISYRIDLSQPSRFTAYGVLRDATASRIVDLTYQGAPVADDMVFVVATNSYRASGGGEFPGASQDNIVYAAPDTNRDVLVRYFVEQGQVRPVHPPNWSFVPMPATSVLFDSSPAASAYLDSVEGLRIEPAGDGEPGFARFRIRL